VIFHISNYGDIAFVGAGAFKPPAVAGSVIALKPGRWSTGH
jgi:hypothetical protein